jgi:hypothetical protein
VRVDVEGVRRMRDRKRHDGLIRSAERLTGRQSLSLSVFLRRRLRMRHEWTPVMCRAGTLGGADPVHPVISQHT